MLNRPAIWQTFSQILISTRCLYGCICSTVNRSGLPATGRKSLNWKECKKGLTRMLPGLEGLSLDRLCIFSLESRRLGGDLIEVS